MSDNNQENHSETETKGLWEETKENVSAAGDVIAEKSGEAWEATKDASGKAWEFTKDASSTAWEATKEGVSALGDKFTRK